MSATVGARIDLNADSGEAFGRYPLDDPAIFDVVSSASIACGMHAGDPIVMRATIEHAARRGIAIGAHPGYPDLQGFGRRELSLTPREIEAYVIYQIGAVAAMCASAGTRMRYVKPHGALYNRAARDVAAADAIAHAVHSVDSSLVLLALSGSEMIAAADRIGLPRASEAFMDRAYLADGTLVPRSEPGSVLTDLRVIAERVLALVHTGTIVARDGASVAVQADSLCAHGDGPDALAVVRAARTALQSAGIVIAPFA